MGKAAGGSLVLQYMKNKADGKYNLPTYRLTHIGKPQIRE